MDGEGGTDDDEQVSGTDNGWSSGERLRELCVQ